jgi:hypothetical protein
MYDLLRGMEKVANAKPTIDSNAYLHCARPLLRYIDEGET